MKKKITIEIICDTEKDNEFIEKTLRRGTYRALDTEPSYISAPKDVESIVVYVEEVILCKECGKVLDADEVEINKRCNYNNVCRICYIDKKDISS